MNRKILSVLTLALLVVISAGFALADTAPKKAKAKRQTNPLVAKLPASDAVAIVDARRFFDQALPQLLASKQEMLGKLTGHMNEFQTKTGIDIRKFDQLVIGANIKNRGPKDMDADFVMLARGSMNVGSLLAAAKIATNAGYREEKIAGRTVYIFSTKSIADKNLPATPATGMSNKAIAEVPKEIAVATFDANTLVIGSPIRVRETFETKSTVAPEITALLAQRANPIFTFASRMPEGSASLIPVANDELGKNIASIKYIAGWTDVTAAGLSMNLMARTANAENAESLYNAISFLRDFGKGILGNSKKPENAVFARLVESAKFARTGTDVTLDLAVAQSDIDLLLATLVKK